MGAEVPWRVKVLKLYEDTVEVDAIHTDEALEEAEKLPGVARAVEIVYDEAEGGRNESLF